MSQLLLKEEIEDLRLHLVGEDEELASSVVLVSQTHLFEEVFHSRSDGGFARLRVMSSSSHNFQMANVSGYELCKLLLGGFESFINMQTVQVDIVSIVSLVSVGQNSISGLLLNRMYLVIHSLNFSINRHACALVTRGESLICLLHELFSLFIELFHLLSEGVSFLTSVVWVSLLFQNLHDNLHSCGSLRASSLNANFEVPLVADDV